MDKKLREFVISVLNNENGISDKSFTILNEIAEKYKLEDIVLAVDSSDYSGDSSEDERIQETIRRKGQRPNRRRMELNDSDVDSDHEDIVTLSRRVIYILRKLSSIEDYLRK